MGTSGSTSTLITASWITDYLLLHMLICTAVSSSGSPPNVSYSIFTSINTHTHTLTWLYIATSKPVDPNPATQPTSYCHRQVGVPYQPQCGYCHRPVSKACQTTRSLVPRPSVVFLRQAIREAWGRRYIIHIDSRV